MSHLMRPYLAVIADSFRAALSSRILWVAFVAIWLLLAALAPIGYREDFTTSFRGQDFHNGTRMKAMLAQGLVDPVSQDQPIGRIAAALPDELRRQLRRVGEGDEVRIRLSVLADALNDLLEDPSWYDSDAWSSTLRLRELRELDETSDADLTPSLQRRRARLRIEAALPGVFESRSSRSIYLTYAGMDFPANLAVDKTQFVTLINQWVLPTIINWLLGFILIFLGILVTASIIPDMLQPGSLHLLLSKPISRSMLLLSKFVGGCAFVLLCVTQLVLGLYLIAGTRLDIWNVRLLWCIPVSVFLFSVFYSVSTLAGLRWRSPILAIGVTSIFGALCLVTGIIGGLFDGLVSRPDRLQHLAIISGDNTASTTSQSSPTLFASTRGGGLVRYDSAENRWSEIFESDAMNQDRIIPPLALNSQTIVTARVRGGRFNPFGSGALDLLVLTDSSEWTPEPSLRLPTATSYLYEVGDDSLLAMNTGDLSIASRQRVLKAAGQREGERIDEQEAEETEDARVEPEAAGLNTWLSKLTNMMGSVTEGFTSVLPERMSISPPRAIAIAADGSFLVTLSRGRLVRLDRPAEEGDADGSAQPWAMTANRSLDGEASARGVVAVEGGVVLLARTDQPILILDAKSLEVVSAIEVDEGNAPVSAIGIPGGDRFALVTADGRLHLISPSAGKADRADAADRSEYQIGKSFGPSEIETVAVDRENKRLYVGHSIDRIDILDIGNGSADDWQTKIRIRPELDRWRWVDRVVVSPLRMLIPQTGELGETIAAMVSGESAVAINNNSDEEELVRYKITRPIFSCATFIAVMLTISCLFFSTRDF